MAGVEGRPVTAEIDPDPNVLTIPQAARLMGVCDDTLRAQLRDDPEFYGRVAVTVGRQIRVSRLRLERYLHGEAS